jgi:hypothetical protein
MRAALVGFAAFAWAVAPAARARAQDDCNVEVPRAWRPEEITPASGAGGVTLDAPIVVRYSRGYFGPEGPGDDPRTLVRVGRCEPASCAVRCSLRDAVPVEGTVQVLGDRLFFLPAGGLAPGTRYVGVATGVDGEITFEFCSGTRLDVRAPTTPRLIAIEPAETRPLCPEGGSKVDVRIAPAEDDGPAGSIEYLLYLTRGRGIVAPELRDRYRNFSTDEVTLHLILAAEEASEPVCVQVFATDGVGRISEPTTERCVDPLTSAAFQPLCAVVPGVRQGVLPRWLVLGLAALAGLAALRLRRAARR